MNKIYIYLKGEEELGEVIEKVKKAQEKEIVLVVPKNTKSLLHPINLEIFKNEIDKLDKKVYLDTNDEKLINLARHFKINIFLSDLEERPIVDIKPPTSSKKKVFEKSEQIPKPNINLKTIFKYLFSLTFVFILIFFLWQIFQTRAEILIETQKTPLELDEIIVLKEGLLKPDIENKNLPAEKVNLEVVKTETIPTTGKVFTEEKPLLSVVFLNYLDKEIPLVAGTRLAFDDNIFRTTEKVLIPKATGNEPGKVTTTAFLDISKSDNLNIPQGSDLKIVALEGKLAEENKLWSDVLKVKTVENYSLTKVNIGSVSPEDITNVKLNLEKSLKNAIYQKLALDYPQSFYYFDPSLVRVEILNISHKVGEKTDKISATGKAFYETMVVPKKDFDDFIKKLINQEILNQKKNLIIENLKYEKIDILEFDSKKNIMTLGVKIKANLVPDINPEIVKEKIKGQTIEWVKNYFANYQGINSIKIKIFPQWKETLPQDIKRIKIEIR